MPGIVALGGPTRGRLHVAAATDGEIRAGGLDVGLAGTILVVGSRIDAETLTRARAMGIRGIVVAGLASKERRDFLASEKRQRAALHRLPPYAVLVLDGAVRRPLSSPVLAVLRALSGHEVAISSDPPALLFDAPDVVAADPARRSRAHPRRRAVEAARGRGPGCSGRAGSPAACTSRPGPCGCRTARSSRSRSATSNGSSDASVPSQRRPGRRSDARSGTLNRRMPPVRPATRTVRCPDPDATAAARARARARSPGRAT